MDPYEDLNTLSAAVWDRLFYRHAVAYIQIPMPASGPVTWDAKKYHKIKLGRVERFARTRPEQQKTKCWIVLIQLGVGQKLRIEIEKAGKRNDNQYRTFLLKNSYIQRPTRVLSLRTRRQARKRRGYSPLQYPDCCGVHIVHTHRARDVQQKNSNGSTKKTFSQ